MKISEIILTLLILVGGWFLIRLENDNEYCYADGGWYLLTYGCIYKDFPETESWMDRSCRDSFGDSWKRVEGGYLGEMIVCGDGTGDLKTVRQPSDT